MRRRRKISVLEGVCLVVVAYTDLTQSYSYRLDCDPEGSGRSLVSRYPDSFHRDLTNLCLARYGDFPVVALSNTWICSSHHESFTPSCAFLTQILGQKTYTTVSLVSILIILTDDMFYVDI